MTTFLLYMHLSISNFYTRNKEDGERNGIKCTDSKEMKQEESEKRSPGEKQMSMRRQTALLPGYAHVVTTLIQHWHSHIAKILGPQFFALSPSGFGELPIWGNAKYYIRIRTCRQHWHAHIITTLGPRVANVGIPTL